jgi:SAM-dependent methyltransferase
MQESAHLPVRRQSPSAERNRDPILQVLRRVLPPAGTVLEIASGTGQHAIHFAAALPGIRWQPSDTDADARDSVEAWRREASLPNLAVPLMLDVHQAPWPLPVGATPLAAMVCINMIHISPWTATQALFEGARQHLAPDGVLYLYGPYKRDGRHTAPSNAAFDTQLRTNDPRWGIRDLADVEALAGTMGFVLAEIVEMPANNLSVVFRRGQ